MTTDEARELAREYIALVISSFEFPKGVFAREVEGDIEIVAQLEDASSLFCYRPLPHTEEAILSISEDIEEKYRTVRDEWEAQERDYVHHSSCVYRVENLIEEFLSRVDRLRQRLEADMRGLPDAATAKGEEKARRYSASFNRAEKWMHFYRRVEELLPLWTCIKGYLKKSEYDGEAYSYLREEPEFRELSTGHDIPAKLIEWAYEKGARRGLPKSLALEHARMELSLPELKIERLYQLYYAGRDDAREEEALLQRCRRAE